MDTKRNAMDKKNRKKTNATDKRETQWAKERKNREKCNGLKRKREMQQKKKREK